MKDKKLKSVGKFPALFLLLKKFDWQFYKNSIFYLQFSPT